jgi:hypothetical protein
MRLSSASSAGLKPGNTCEPPGASALSRFRCPPSIHDAVSPRVIWKRSLRNTAPTAMLTGAGNPRRSAFAAVTPASISSRTMRPAKNDVWLAMPGSSVFPSMPSSPGAHGATGSRHGPSDTFSVLRRR